MDFQKTAEAISKNNAEPEWLKQFRLDALKQFEAQPAPSRNDEEWRRSDISKFVFSDLNLAESAISVSRDANLWIPAQNSAGQSAYHLTGENAKVVFDSLSSAAQKNPDLVKPFLDASSRADRTKFYWLANALWNGGVFVHVPKNLQVELPLSVLFRAASAANAKEGRKSVFSKIVIVVEENSSVNFWLDQVNGDADEVWVHQVIDVHLKSDARISFLNVQRTGDKTTLISNFNAYLGRNASLDLLTVEAGAGLAKQNWSAHLLEEGASAKVFGLVRGKGTQHFDETLYVCHQKPNTESEVLFKTVVADQARSAFTGLIHVLKEAKKTKSYQTNRNLLLSKEARADTIPKLEIETDDVKCGHGAAVSSIDEEQIYYLTSRGLSRDVAKALIIEGFYEDVLVRWMKEDDLKNQNSAELHSKLSDSIRRVLVGEDLQLEAVEVVG